MAGSRIKGITVEIGGDTTGLDKALKGVNASISKTQSALKDVNRLLKLDPSNTELLAQKQKYLQSAISETKDKLEALKQADEQAKKQLDAGELGQDKYDALQREIVDTEEKLKSLEDEVKKMPTAFGASLKEAGQKISDVGDKITKVGTGLSTHVTAPLAAVGAAGLAAFQDVDAGMDIVVQKTGASGEALEAMQQSVKNLATEIPTDFETAGAAIGEVNTRFGLTGQALEDLSAQFIQFANLNDTDVSSSIDNTQKVLEAFGMSTSEAGSLLDAMNKTGQDTGISMDTLAQDLVANSEQMKDMGYNAYEASAFLGQCEKSGADVSTVLAGLKKAQQNATSEGKTLNQALSDFSGVMNSNASDTEKLQAAYDLFGKKAGASIYDAMQTGSLSFGELSASASDSLGSVSDTFQSTLDPIDQFQLTLNQAKLTGADIGNSLSSVLMPILQELSDAMKTVSDAWNSLSPGMQEAIVKIALIAAAVGPVLVGVGKVVSAIGSITSGFGSLVNGIGGAISSFGALSASILPVIGIVAAVVAAIVAVIEIVKHWGEISEWMKGVWDTVCQGVETAINTVSSVMSTVWNTIKTTITNAMNGIASFLSGAWDTISSTVSSVWDGITSNISSAMEAIANTMSTIWDGIVSVATTVWDTIKNVVTVAILFLKEIFTAAITVLTLPWQFIWENFGDEITAAFEKIKSVVTDALSAIENVISTVWNAIKDFMAPILTSIGDAVTTAWNAIKDAVSTAMDAIATAVSTVWNAVKDVVTTVVGAIKDAVTTAWNAIKDAVTTVLDTIKTKVSNAWSAIKDTVSAAVNAIQDVVTNVWNAIKTTISNVMDAIKTTTSNVWNSIKSHVTNVVNGIKSTVSSVFGSIKDTASSVWNSIKNAITTPINAAKDAVHSAIEKMKSFFHFSWSLPHLKLPHFGITGSFSLNPPSVPHFSVDWYKKAMEGGMILDSPTIFGAKDGKLLAGGEAGSEAVVGTRSLMDMIQSAVQATTKATTNIRYGDVTINVYGAPGQDVNELADAIEERIGEHVMRKEAVFA